MKRLALIHTFDGQQEFTEGHNCDRIRQLDNGCYIVFRGEREDTIPAHRVDVFTHIPRPGLTPEPQTKAERNGLSPEPVKPPKYALKDTAGGWRCFHCDFRSETVHGVKVHASMVHGRT